MIKPSAADPRFLKHTGPALAFESYDEMAAAVADEDLDVTADHVLVLKNAGPVGAGMPEWGMLPVPVKLLKQGVREMMRISDARMSGTSYGACILHVSPEAAIGGPLALVRTGDLIEVDVEARQVNLLVAEDELQRRTRSLAAQAAAAARLRPDVRPAHQPGPRRLRLRLPPRHRATPRARNPLTRSMIRQGCAPAKPRGLPS